MSEPMDLEEFKKENEEEERKLALKEGKNPDDEPEEESDDEPDVEDSEDESDAEEKSDEESDEDEKAEDWTSESDSDEESDEEEESKPTAKDSEYAKIRRKYQQREKDKARENEELKAKIAEIEEKLKAKPKAATDLQKPKREAFKTDDEYFEALFDYREERKAAESQSENLHEQHKKRLKEITEEREAAVEEHYDRAIEVAKKSNIAPEKYQSADSRVRAAVEEVMPKAGDLIVDTFIHRLGAGSEKVMYHLGVNKAARDEFISLYKKDPEGGFEAYGYLVSLREKFKNVVKRDTSAPRPPNQIRGDRAKKGKGAALKSDYDKAHQKGNSQQAMDIKFKAKSAGVDTSSW